MNKHVETLEKYFTEKRDHFAIHDRGFMETFLKDLKGPDIQSVNWEVKSFGNRYNAIQIGIFYRKKRSEGERYFYIDDTTYWRVTGREVFETVGSLDALGKFDELNDPLVLEAIFGVMHMGEDLDVADAVFNYQLRDDKLVHVSLSRYKGLVKVRWPK